MEQTIDEEKCCCPICGHVFDPVEDINMCPTEHYQHLFSRDELIGYDEDYAWVL